MQKDKRKRRHARIRKVVQGTAERPRLAVFKSLTATYAQLIDDDKGITLASASDIKDNKGTKTERAKNVGLEIAKKAKDLKLTSVVFDRAGYKYHGRIKAVADGAREGGLEF